MKIIQLDSEWAVELKPDDYSHSYYIHTLCNGGPGQNQYWQMTEDKKMKLTCTRCNISVPFETAQLLAFLTGHEAMVKAYSPENKKGT